MSTWTTPERAEPPNNPIDERAALEDRLEYQRVTVLDGSTLGGSPFCVGGTIRDSHASTDPAVESTGHLIARTITCPDGTVRAGFTPQTASWTVVSGTGAYEGLRGSGELEVKDPADEDALGHETLTGTVTR